MSHAFHDWSLTLWLTHPPPHQRHCANFSQRSDVYYYHAAFHRSLMLLASFNDKLWWSSVWEAKLRKNKSAKRFYATLFLRPLSLFSSSTVLSESLIWYVNVLSSSRSFCLLEWTFSILPFRLESQDVISRERLEGFKNKSIRDLENDWIVSGIII